MIILQSVIPEFARIFIPKKINPQMIKKEPIYFTEKQYCFMQDGTVNMYSWDKAKEYALNLKSLLSPKSILYCRLCSVDSLKTAYKNSPNPIQDRELFKSEWIALYDQVVSTFVDIKASGGMFAGLNQDYFEDKTAEIRSAQDETFLSEFRHEMQNAIRNCVAYNYYESLFLNSLLRSDQQIVILKRSESHQIRIAQEIADKRFV